VPARAEVARADGAAEGVAAGDEPAAAGAAREVGRRGEVVHAAREVARSAIADAHRADAGPRERDAEIVGEALGRAGRAAHRTAAREHDVLGVAGTVPRGS
jgi:hypothetical protein